VTQIDNKHDPNAVRVLFAVDSENTIVELAHIVDTLSWEGIYVKNAIEIIDTVNSLLAQGRPPDAVVANIAFAAGPKVTGITAAREIRKALPNVPMIFLSNYVTSIIREEVRRVGAEIFPKPFDITELFGRLGHLIYWHRLAIANEYQGENRRRNSVNTTGNQNRATDYILTTPERIAEAIEDAEKENEQNERRDTETDNVLGSYDS
jgi:DNA-binding response OmpR family regulator